MSDTMKTPIAKTKIIAAGATADGRLRGTVILTPHCVDSKGAFLEGWPGEMIAALEGKNWTLNLEIEPVAYADGGQRCPPPSGSTHKFAAHAEGLARAWSAGNRREWLNALWRQAFTVDDKLDWSELAGLIKKSTEGEALSGPTDYSKPGKAPERKATDRIKQITAARSGKLKIESILPTRQSDLAFVLECKRALELCDTIRHADGTKDCAIEAACVAAAKAPVVMNEPSDGGTEVAATADSSTPKAGEEPINAQGLFNQARRRFSESRGSAQEAYSEIVCNGTPTARLPTTMINREISATKRVALEALSHPALDASEAANVAQYDKAAWRKEWDEEKEAAKAKSARKNKNEEKQKEPLTSEERLEVVSQRFFYIQGSPALSRLFGLTFDVYLPATMVEAVLDEKNKTADGGSFAYVSVDGEDICSDSDTCRIFTLAKFNRCDAAIHFWPASRGEMRLGRKASPEGYRSLFQYDGLVMTAQRVYQEDVPPESAASAPRFDVSSLDVRAAIEGAIDRRMSEASQDEVQRQYEESVLACRPMAVARKTHITGGLTILDRGRQHQAIAQLAARDVHQATQAAGARLLLDSEDLTIGYRIDVGVAIKNCDDINTAKEDWRSLMARQIVHGTTGDYAANVRAVIPSLFQDSAASVSDEWRRCLEDGILALSARIVPRNGTESDSEQNAALGTDDPPAPDLEGESETQVDAYVEESISTWQGEPMAAAMGGAKNDKVQRIKGMPTGSVIKLPTDTVDPHRRPFALRFGWPYGFGMRAVYPGGISIPLQQAINRYKQIDRGCKRVDVGSVTIPSSSNVAMAWGSNKPRDRDRMRRHLRQERIDAPYLLLPKSIATKANGAMGYERAAHAIIRTAKVPGNGNRDAPEATQRIFVAPCVSSWFAAMHGVFDKVGDKRAPRGLAAPKFGPHGVRFDAKTGGFPIAAADSIVGIDGARYDRVRFITNETDRYTGELVYALADSRQLPNEKHHYYPDPAVEHYAIGVRYVGTDTYLKGGPCIIRADTNSRSYPNTPPLALTIARSGRSKNPHPLLDDVLSWSESGRCGLGCMPRLPGSVEAVLRLLPGEEFEVDVWCIPSAKRLACEFGLIDDIGTLAVLAGIQESKESSEAGNLVGDKAQGPTKAQVTNALLKLLPARVHASIKARLPSGLDNDEIKDWSRGYAGIGSLPGPGPETLLAIAHGIHELLTMRPLDEIAAVRTLRVTHAIDRPHAVPNVLPTNSILIKLKRVAMIEQGKVRPEIHATHGIVQFHLPTTGSLEVRARVYSPTSQAIDDVRRGRSLRDRREGQWPKDAVGNAMTAEQVFGFSLTSDGEPIFPGTEVTLQQLEQIPLRLLAVCDEAPRPAGVEIVNGNCKLALSTFFGRANPSAELGPSKLPFQFKDPLARKLRLEFRAHPRHAEQMRTASPPARDGRWLRDPKLLDAEKCSVDGGPVEVWVPAGVRPAEPVALSPVPAFVWDRKTPSEAVGKNLVHAARRSVVRIPLERPWFSSGEGERLGIVVWPPNIDTQDPEAFGDDRVTLPPQVGSATGRTVDLSTFADEDLGAGGKFVTRWGGDPIRPAAGLHDYVYDDTSKLQGWVYQQVPFKHTFVPHSAFLYSKGTALGFEGTFVPGVDMPVRQSDKAAGSDNPAAQLPPLQVSLITYAPRFDIENEQWYVDVGIEHPTEAEPFVRLGLVRYQENAPADLRVSYPVIQWAQLLPRRTVAVGVETAAETKIFSVRVHGIALLPGKMAEPPQNAERYPDYQMTTTIVREHVLESGAIERRVVESRRMEVCSVDTAIINGAHERIWREKLAIDIEPTQDAAEKPTYSLFISEREARLPATYAEEPVTPYAAIGKDCNNNLDNTLLIEAGPRFLAHIKIQGATTGIGDLCKTDWN